MDLGIRRDRVLAGDQGVSEPNEAGLLLGITRGLISSVNCDLVEANVLLLPVWQGKLELVVTLASDRLG